MPVLHDEVPDDDDFDAGRQRGEFDGITPDDFIRSTGGMNPPGWLTAQQIDEMRSQTPLPYVVVLPVKTNELGRLEYVGSLLTASADDGVVARTLITGRVLFHESIREAMARNISKDLGDMTLAKIPVNLQPFMVAEFFPTPSVSQFYDARQHAIALCYMVEIAGECQPQDETLDVEWVTPQEARKSRFLNQFAQGFSHIVVQGLNSSGAFA